MIDIEDVYFEWLLTCLDPDGVREGVVHLCSLLHNCEFERRVGNDINRAKDGIHLRKDFLSQFSDADLDPHVTNDLMAQDCSWFEMLVALSIHLDYLYDGGVETWFLEMTTNMGLKHLTAFNVRRNTPMVREYDQRFVDVRTSDVDNNRFDRDGHGGIFPLLHAHHPDQREVQIWDQQGSYFNEKYEEGVLWTSTS